MASKFGNNYVPEFFALFAGRSKPAMVSVNITAKCNQKCIYCEIGQSIPTSTTDTLSVDDLKWIIDQMEINKIPKFSINGGEPFLFDKIIDIVEYAGLKKIHCSITTNGMTVYKLSDGDLDVLKKTGTEINVSIDSFRNEIETFTRGAEAALSNALKSLDKLMKKKIPVTILTAISKYNSRTLFESFVEAYNYGVRQVLYQPIIYYSNYPDRHVLDDKANMNIDTNEIDKLKDELKKILKFEKSHHINTNVYRILPWIEHYLRSASNRKEEWFFHKVLKKFYCREVDAIIEISYDGSILPCGLAPAKLNIHNNKESGLMELWNEATGELREDMKKEKYHGYCNACCHHFSRNMLASIMKYPVKNRKALIIMLPLISARIWYRMLKNLLN